MAKEFDIYLRDRLVECDLLVYSIPYRDGITVTNRLILEAALKNYLLRKLTTVNSGLKVDSHIDRMIKLCLEKLGMEIGLGTTVEFEKRVKLYIDNTPIIVDTQNVETVGRVFSEAKNGIAIAVDPIIAQVSTSAGRMNTSLAIGTNVADLFKRSLLSLHSSVSPCTEIMEIHQADYLRAGTETVIHPTLQSLCYQLTSDANAAIELMTLVLGTELRHSLGRWYNSMAISAKAAWTWAQKFIDIRPEMFIELEADGVLNKFVRPEESSTIISVPSVEFVKRRYRLLYEVDDKAISDLDDMSLEDIDYVTL